MTAVELKQLVKVFLLFFAGGLITETSHMLD